MKALEPVDEAQRFEREVLEQDRRTVATAENRCGTQPLRRL